jgi:AbrB family looped-hinge helix DNA binding protein
MCRRDFGPLVSEEKLNARIHVGYDEIVLQTPDRSERSMETTTVSPKYQVVIPLRVRRALKIRPGQKVQVIPYEGRVELIPLKPVKAARGFLKGIDTAVDRERDRV